MVAVAEHIKVPELRFPDFSGDWEEKFGNEVFDRITDKNHKSDLPILAISQEHGAIPREMIDYDISVTAESVASYKVVSPGDFIISLRSFQGGLEYSRYKGICSPAYIILRARIAIEDLFFKEFFKTYSYILQLKSKLEGIRDGKMVSYKYFSETIIPYPTLPEQQKIAEFLTAVDEKIGQLKRKKELLEAYKKGAMQKLFSQEIRFKDDQGNPYPDWEEKRLEDISRCLDSKRKPLNSNERNRMKGSIPYYGANGIVDYVDDYLFDEELVLMAEDGGNFFEFSNKPIAQLISGRSWVNNHAHILKAKVDFITTDFLFYSLVHKDIRRFIVGGSRAKLNKSDLMSITLFKPRIQEQQKIAEFLTGIDDKINAVANQIDKAVEFKKGLLQKMFV